MCMWGGMYVCVFVSVYVCVSKHTILLGGQEDQPEFKVRSM